MRTKTEIKNRQIAARAEAARERYLHRYLTLRRGL